MTTKFMFILLRGIKLFSNYFRYNLLSLFALSALFLILHTSFGLGSGMASFAGSAANFDKIRVYLTNNEALTVTSVQDVLDGLPEKAETKYYAPADAKEFIKAGAGSLSGVDKLPNELFPQFIELIVKPEYAELEQLDTLSSNIAKISGVQQVSYGQEWAQQLSRGKNAVITMLTIVSVLFGIVGIVLIYQIVSITLYRYKKEVHVYSLVGGTNFFVTMPFVVVAVCTSLVCSCVSLIAYLAFRAALLVSIEEALGLNLSIGLQYVGIFILAALLASMLAGMVSAANFLRTARSDA